MIGPFNWIDLLFVVTIVLLVFNGLRNGALFSLVNLLAIPIGIGVAYFFGKQFTVFLASNGLSLSPIISYLVLFFGTILVLHIIGTALRGVVSAVPVVGLGDSLIGGVIGFVEAWLLWLIALFIIGNFLQSVQNSFHTGSQAIPGLTITVQQYQVWRDTYNQAVHNSLFAKVNGFFIKELPAVSRLG
jgi:uncharacterized membrane protein required for colicin V production